MVDPVAEKYRQAAEHNRDAIASEMTPTQIAEAEKLADEWKPEVIK